MMDWGTNFIIYIFLKRANHQLFSSEELNEMRVYYLEKIHYWLKMPILVSLKIKNRVDILVVNKWFSVIFLFLVLYTITGIWYSIHLNYLWTYVQFQLVLCRVEGKLQNGIKFLWMTCPIQPNLLSFPLAIQNYPLSTSLKNLNLEFSWLLLWSMES